MQLYFFRHAEAGYDFGGDFERTLTERGIKRTETAGRVLKRLDLNLLHLYTSPRIRALQTARILAEALGMEGEVKEGLDFGFNVNVVEGLAHGLGTDDAILFVGHEPSMSTVVRTMTGANVDMKKGGMARVDVHFDALPLHGELVWLIAPRVFDALGRKG